MTKIRTLLIGIVLYTCYLTVNASFLSGTSSSIQKIGLMTDKCVLTNYVCDGALGNIEYSRDDDYVSLQPRLSSECLTMYTSSYGRGLYQFKKAYYEIPPPGNISCYLNKCNPIFSRFQFYLATCTKSESNFNAIFTDDQL